MQQQIEPSPIWRPYTQEKIAAPSTFVSSAKGSYIFEPSGRAIFDGISSWWLTTHGHCHPLIVEAIQKQAERVCQVTFANFTHEPAEELADLLLQVTPQTLNRVFFSDNGSTAVEVAMKMALQACAQSGQPLKTKFLAFEKSYHGDTVGAMSVSGRHEYSAPYKSTLFDVERASHPALGTVQSFVQDFESTIEMNCERLAAVIVEPLIQGAGGMIFWPPDALERIVAKCRELKVYLIFDEVMTGFGRTGKMFAMNSVSHPPDMVCFSKGLTGGTLPLAATMASEEIYNAFYSSSRSRMLFHGHSFTGNAISCAAAVASLKLSMTESFLPSLSRISEAQRKGLSQLEGEVMNSRVCGTVAAFEIEGESPRVRKILETTFQDGLFLRSLGSTFYLMPPYSSSKTDIETAWQILRNSINRS